MTTLLNKNFVTELGLDKLPPERQAVLFAKIGEVIFQGVLIRVLELMDEKQQASFQEVVDGAGEDVGKIVTYLEEKVPNFNHVVELEVEMFKKNSLDLINQIK